MHQPFCLGVVVRNVFRIEEDGRVIKIRKAFNGFAEQRAKWKKMIRASARMRSAPPDYGYYQLV
jgi:hypothetical protein